MASCGKEYACRVPIGDATCQVDPNSPLYPGLNYVGGYEYLVGGYSGIVVANIGWTGNYDVDMNCPYVAYERTCPADSGRLEMAPGFGNVVLECQRCGSQFNTYSGEPIEGSRTSCMLYRYQTFYDGITLYISNY